MTKHVALCTDKKPHKMVYKGMMIGHVCKKCGISLVELNQDQALPSYGRGKLG